MCGCECVSRHPVTKSGCVLQVSTRSQEGMWVHELTGRVNSRNVGTNECFAVRQWLIINLLINLVPARTRVCK